MTEPRADYQAAVKAVEIRAELRQVKSMVDHTYNITLNLPEECLPQAQQLMAWIGNEVKAVIETC
jgi:hypothetical protein